LHNKLLDIPDKFKQIKSATDTQMLTKINCKTKLKPINNIRDVKNRSYAHNNINKKKLNNLIDKQSPMPINIENIGNMKLESILQLYDKENFQFLHD
jgi:hypothetical protein